LEKLDIKDRKILYYLDLDSRQSFTSIGRKVGLHKDSVADRVKKLQDKGIIFNFYSQIDLSKLGYTHFRYYFVLRYLTPEKRKEIIEYLVNNKYSLTVNTLEGQYDLSVYMAVKNIYNFYHFWDQTFIKYNKYISKRAFSLFCYENLYGYTFLLNDNISERKDFEYVSKYGGYGGRSPFIIDNLDIKILNLITDNARMSIIDIAEKLKSSTQTIKNRINNLIKLKIISGFKTEIDFSKLEYHFYRLDINLIEQVKKQPIISYIIKNPHIRSVYGSMGDAADLEFEIFLKNINQLHKFVEDITHKFPNCIKDYKYHTSIKRHKNITIPEE
jgi:DNA-binding Lrp family transcriptional regulator